MTTELENWLSSKKLKFLESCKGEMPYGTRHALRRHSSTAFEYAYDQPGPSVQPQAMQESNEIRTDDHYIFIESDDSSSHL